MHNRPQRSHLPQIFPTVALVNQRHTLYLGAFRFATTFESSSLSVPAFFRSVSFAAGGSGGPRCIILTIWVLITPKLQQHHPERVRSFLFFVAFCFLPLTFFHRPSLISSFLLPPYPQGPLRLLTCFAAPSLHLTLPAPSPHPPCTPRTCIQVVQRQIFP